ncbi:MAG: hypothetical protein NXH82_14215 [Rhodobacteraceae bacterium]|nr:hypothetical protein [Paracoccaceae bacterium]
MSAQATGQFGTHDPRARRARPDGFMPAFARHAARSLVTGGQRKTALKDAWQWPAIRRVSPRTALLVADATAAGAP